MTTGTTQAHGQLAAASTSHTSSSTCPQEEETQSQMFATAHNAQQVAVAAQGQSRKTRMHMQHGRLSIRWDHSSSQSSEQHTKILNLCGQLSYPYQQKNRFYHYYHLSPSFFFKMMDLNRVVQSLKKL